MNNWLVCGTRKKGYRERVFDELGKLRSEYGFKGLISENPKEIAKAFDWKPDSIIEGCCPDSADVWAEEWAIEHNIPIQHFPSHAGNYLKRNIEMVEKADLIIAFWDGFSYGTCHTIATAILKGKIVKIIDLRKKK